MGDDWVAAALAFAFATACGDRDRGDTANWADNAAEEASAEVQEGARDVGEIRCANRLVCQWCANGAKVLVGDHLRAQVIL